MSEPERVWRQAPAPDLNTLIAENLHRRRHGKHAPLPRARHAAPPSERSKRMRGPIQWTVLIVSTVVVVLLLRGFVVASFYIPSASMEPTLHGCDRCQPDRVMVDKLFYHLTGIGRGDVIVFSKPPALLVNDKDLIKRVIGLPGETVEARQGVVFVDNKPLTEPYVLASCQGTANFGPVVVSAGHLFVMGDNRCNSTDSRVFGTIAKSTIIGRAFAVVWPLRRVHWL